MLRRRPDILALLVAIIGSVAVLGAFTFDLLASRQRDLDENQRRLQHFSVMLAEHTARTFEAVDILLREIAADLSTSNGNWRKWDPVKGWEYVSQRHSRSLPQLRDLIVFDETGLQRYISTYFPAPGINVHDRPYFVKLSKEDVDATTYGPYVGRNSGRYTYALARRIRDARGVFSGVSFAAIEPAYFQDFCWSNRLADEFEAALVNAKGRVVASCRPRDLGPNATFVGSLATDGLYDGRLRNQILPETGLATIAGIQLSVSPVPHFSDLRIIALLPVDSITSPWKRRALEFGILAGLVVGVLLIGGWQVWRRAREMQATTLEIESHRRQLVEQFEAATAEIALQKNTAERANQAKSRFLAAASHDLRQPLHALSLFAADLQRQVRAGKADELPRLADQIQASSSVLGELLDSLLDISRLDVAGIAINPQAFSIQLLFDRLDASFQRSAQNRLQRLLFRPTSLKLISDPVLIERLLANLISNALRYTPEKGSILVLARKRRGHLLIEVRDNGIGIAPEHQAAIFGEFYQIGNAARESRKGLGLGLSIVDRLARALHCSVTLRSQIGAGTTFAVLLPDDSQAARIPALERLADEERHTILFFGVGGYLESAAQLAATWGMPVQHVADPVEMGALALLGIVVAEERCLAISSPDLAAHSRLIVVTDSPEQAAHYRHGLSTPIRPAKLRALLEQLQKS